MLAGAAESLRQAGGHRLEEWERSLSDRYVAELRLELDGKTFERQWELGRTMTLDEAVAAAIGE